MPAMQQTDHNASAPSGGAHNHNAARGGPTDERLTAAPISIPHGPRTQAPAGAQPAGRAPGRHARRLTARMRVCARPGRLPHSNEAELVAMGALKELTLTSTESDHGELKSMRTSARYLRQGTAQAVRNELCAGQPEDGFHARVRTGAGHVPAAWVCGVQGVCGLPGGSTQSVCDVQPIADSNVESLYDYSVLRGHVFSCFSSGHVRQETPPARLP